MSVRLSKSLKELLENREAEDAQLEAYRYSQRLKIDPTVFGMNNYIVKEPLEMKAIIEIYEVSNGYMAVVNNDPDRNTVVGSELTEVVNAATSLFAQRKLEQKETNHSNSDSQNRLALIKEITKQANDTRQKLTFRSFLPTPPPRSRFINWFHRHFLCSLH
jgi:hypothetical protein